MRKSDPREAKKMAKEKYLYALNLICSILSAEVERGASDLPDESMEVSCIISPVLTYMSLKEITAIKREMARKPSPTI
jgi:hypothetical protein